MSRDEARSWARRILKYSPSGGTSEVHATAQIAMVITAELEAGGYVAEQKTLYPGRVRIDYRRRASA